MLPREQLLAMYQAALQAVYGREQVAYYLHQHPYHMPLAAIAIGKAATEMLSGAFDILGKQISHALLITKQGHLNRDILPDTPITCIESAHPVPNHTSLKAGQTLLKFIRQLPRHYPILFLTSGGASALVEVLTPHVTLDDLQEVNRWLLASGLDIHAMNQIRKSLSAIKGGRLAYYLQGHPVLNLLISDVPGDDLHSIGSGLLVPHQSMTLPPNLPPWLQRLLTHACPLSKMPAFHKITHHIIANPKRARQAACTTAKRLGYYVECKDKLVLGDALIAGKQLANYVIRARPGVYIWSSETTVQLPLEPGEGGRCQSLALAAAIELDLYQDIYLLAAGTDGNDGISHVAGALVDGHTVLRGRAQGFDATQSLARADAGRYLAASGDLIYTGTTGTNVMDIIIGLQLT